ncbi:hypothetical protein, partial [Sphingorhabdus sp. Alg231-15]|uniref:hypothetical protein n=1 Tax=Sphingorhabdus sp. Alg231-15 TaxID=1922222 RepID=UPI00307C05D9
MISEENIWKFGGAGILTLLSGFALIQGVTIYTPTPLYIILFAWIIPPLAVVLMPICYVVVLHLGIKSPRFSLYVLILCLMFSALNAWSIYG